MHIEGSDDSRFWATYVPRLKSAPWFVKKLEKAAAIAREPRRHHDLLIALSFERLLELEERGKRAGSRRVAAHKKRIEAEGLETDQGNQEARRYLRRLRQLAGQAFGSPEMARCLHEFIQRREGIEVPHLPTPTGAAASGMMFLVAGGQGATGPAMQAAQRWRRDVYGPIRPREKLDEFKSLPRDEDVL